MSEEKDMASGRATHASTEPASSLGHSVSIPDAERVLVRIKHGSHLYGTNTPESDMDFKSVHIPAWREILLQRADKTLDRRVKLSGGLKNTPEDIDDQSYSVKKFLEMLAAGDTNAAEILFAPPSAIVYASDDWPELQAKARRLINRQCRGFVGYCRRQAAKYGIKGSRMAAVKRLLDILEPELATRGGAAKMAEIEPAMRAFAANEEHADWLNIPHPNGVECWHIECCDRKMPTTATIKEAASVYGKVWENYGARARAAMTNEGIDWKAVSHAVRVARQAIELLQTGRITFPRPDADELREIKQGHRDYNDVSPMLEALVEQVEAEAERSQLPEKSDIRELESIVIAFYAKAIEARQGGNAAGGAVHESAVAESHSPDTPIHPVKTRGTE